MSLISALYGPVVMILLRSDLEVLLADGDLDLEELGLAMEEDEDRPDGVVMTTLKNLAKRARQGSYAKTSDESEMESQDQ